MKCYIHSENYLHFSAPEAVREGAGPSLPHHNWQLSDTNSSLQKICCISKRFIDTAYIYLLIYWFSCPSSQPGGPFSLCLFKMERFDVSAVLFPFFCACCRRTGIRPSSVFFAGPFTPSSPLLLRRCLLVLLAWFPLSSVSGMRHPVFFPSAELLLPVPVLTLSDSVVFRSFAFSRLVLCLPCLGSRLVPAKGTGFLRSGRHLFLLLEALKAVCAFLQWDLSFPFSANFQKCIALSTIGQIR